MAPAEAAAAADEAELEVLRYGDTLAVETALPVSRSARSCIARSRCSVRVRTWR